MVELCQKFDCLSYDHGYLILTHLMSSQTKNKINLSTYTHNKYKHLVDKSCPEKFLGNVHIHINEEHLLWCTLNQTDLETNSNKYYTMQLLKHDKVNSYFLLTRSGRVGYENKKDFKCFLNEQKALDEYKKIFYERTGYTWNDRFSMTKKDGKYDYVEMEVDKETDTTQVSEDKKSSADIKLDSRVELFIKLIFDLKMFENTMKQFKIDTTKAPLGKISSNQIKKAYGILTQIHELIKSDIPMTDKKYLNLSSSFYTFIPTSHGNQKLPTITTLEQFKEKCELLDILGEMEVLGNIMSKVGGDSSQTLQQYNSLSTVIKPVDNEVKKRMIHKFLENTRGATHAIKLGIRQIYEVERSGETDRFKTKMHVGNRQLLWHGSRLSNFVGILSQGLRIAPPEAPATGYMFGKGVYFANSVTKSANYMHAENGTGVILLCEVALGNTYQRKQAEYITTLPDGYHSTWGLGQNTPDIKETMVDEEGMIVPLGHLVSSGRSNLSLAYDEFIVYDVSQIRIRYVLILDTN